MAAKKNDWSKFTKRIFINVPAAKIYSAWAIPKQLTEWFLEKAEYTRPDGSKRPSNQKIEKGDNHQWKWHNWDFIETGEVLEANGKDRISFPFGDGGNVHIYLKKAGESTEVKLIQDNIPTNDKAKMNYYAGCSTGWTFWLTNLKAWLEYGITLNAKGLTQSETQDLVNS